MWGAEDPDLLSCWKAGWNEAPSLAAGSMEFPSLLWKLPRTDHQGAANTNLLPTSFDIFVFTFRVSEAAGILLLPVYLAPYQLQVLLFKKWTMKE